MLVRSPSKGGSRNRVPSSKISLGNLTFQQSLQTPSVTASCQCGAFFFTKPFLICENASRTLYQSILVVNILTCLNAKHCYKMTDEYKNEERPCLWRNSSESRASSAPPAKTLLNLDNNDGHISKYTTDCVQGVFKGSHNI